MTLNKTRHVFYFLCLFLSCCTTDRTDEFTYEIIKGERHLEVTKANLIKLYELNKKDLVHLLTQLNYEIQDKFVAKNKLGYIQKVDSVSGVFQLINSTEDPTKIVKLTWVSFDNKDRFAKFLQDVEQSDIDMKYSSEETCILHHEGQQYMTSIEDVVVGKVISILKMKEYK